MSTTRTGRAITMTADNDAYAGIVSIAGITFQGSGLTPGERLRLTDTGGTPVVDYLVPAETDNADLWNGRPPLFYMGLKCEDGPSGTWVLTIITE